MGKLADKIARATGERVRREELHPPERCSRCGNTGHSSNQCCYCGSESHTPENCRIANKARLMEIGVPPEHLFDVIVEVEDK